MRGREPQAWTRDALQRNCISLYDAIALHCFELVIVEKGRAKAEGKPDPFPDMQREWIVVTMLDPGYREYGISKGMSETRELVRRLERAAADQTKHASR